MAIRKSTKKSSRSYSGKKAKTSISKKKHFLKLLLLLVLFAIGTYAIWQWIKTHIRQSVFVGAIFAVFFALALWKLQRFRGYMSGPFWGKLWSFLKPSERTEKIKRLEEKFIKTPPLPQGDKDRLIVIVGNKCEICPQTYSLDVHHITPRSEGGSNKETNLIVICPTCHRAAHNGGIPKSRLRYIARNRQSANMNH